ncbi:MAG TPA: amidase [Acidimicrobiia bacterium]|nr:amidase [Acidimicrobiia bacterium]
MSTFITKLDSTGDGPRLAVKDLVDIAGVPTTAGSRALEKTAQPAAADAPCLAGARAAGARLVGKTNLHELAMLPIGTNPWFGTPVNPLDPDLIPGGSSSGSAVAVAAGEADVAIGSDTGGSVRVPSACCGTAGLKTTHGRVSLDGVWPLAPSLDTIGPMATTVSGLSLGMQLLEPGFAPAPAPATTVGRIRTSGHPDIEAAVDAALRAAELEVVTLDWEPFEAGSQAFAPIYFDEMWDVDHALVEANPEEVGPDIAQTVGIADMFRPGVGDARRIQAEWRESLSELFGRVELLALPTMPIFPPRLDEIDENTLLPMILELTKHVALFNAAGTPCTAQPVPVPGNRLPASLQLVGPMGSEELLLTTAQRVEQALGQSASR